MAKFVPDASLDLLLAETAKGNVMIVTAAQPADRAAATGNALATGALTTGDGNGDYTIANGDASGRKVTVAEQTLTIVAAGTAGHVNLINATGLVLVTTCAAQALTTGGTATVSAFDQEVADAT